MKTRVTMARIGKLKKYFLGLMCLLLIHSTLSATPKINAFFKENGNGVGAYIDYVIEVTDGAITGNIELPQIDRAQVVGASTGCSVNNINGKTTQKLFYVFNMQIDGIKEIAMPEFQITIDNTTMNVPSAKFTLSEKALLENDWLKNLSFIQAESDRSEVFLGESFKLKLNLFLVDGVKASLLSKSPKKLNDTFIEKFVSEMEETNDVIEIGNKKYKKLSWEVVLTPVKSGLQTIEYDMGIAVWLKNKHRQLSHLNNFFANFDHSINDTMFDKRVDIECQSKPFEIKILSLPLCDDQNFSKSVGVFKFEELDISSEQSIINEPIILKISIDGYGNFGTGAPVLTESDLWEIHQPKSYLDPVDQLLNHYTKIFEFALIPKKAGVLELPKQIQYMFFDIEKKEYVTITKDIEKKVIIARDEKSFITSTKSVLKQSNFEKPAEFLPIKVEMQTLGSFKKITDNWFFWFVNIFVITGAFIKMFIRRRFVKLNGNKDFAKKREARLRFGKAIINMERAANLEDPISFFAFAQYAIRECIGLQQGSVGMAMTFQDIKTTLQDQKMSDKLFKDVKAIYEKGDEIRFGSSTTDEIDFNLKELFKTYKTTLIDLRNLQKDSK